MSQRPKSPSTRPSRGPPRTSTRPKARKTVLVVEDDTKTRELLVHALSTKYAVHSASDGVAATELLATIAPPDAVVCDIMMPRMDGFDFVKNLKADVLLKRTPVLLLTARTDSKDVLKGINLGARHYLTKPFSLKDLLEKVGKVLGE